MKDNQGRELVKISELSVCLSIPVTTIRAWCTSGKLIPALITPTKHRLFNIEDVYAQLSPEEKATKGKETSKDVTESWGEVEEVPDVVPTKADLDKVGIGGYTKAEIAEQRETAKRNGALAALKWAEEAEEETTKRNAALEWAEEEYEEDITDIFNP